MYLDRKEFLAVAKACVKFNPYLKDRDPEDLVITMESHAYSMTKPGYMSTSGYVLTAFDYPTGGLGVKPSVSASIL